MRDWIESQLGLIKKGGDERKLSAKVNAALQEVSVSIQDDYENQFGSLGEVEITWQSGLLVVTTQAGIICQQDASAYVYKQIDGVWRRIWQSEQDDYAHYAPQHIATVHVCDFSTPKRLSRSTS